MSKALPGGMQDRSVSGQSVLCPPDDNIGNLEVKNLTDLKDAALCSRSQVDLRTVISVSSQVKNEKKNVVY